jgi:succinoglycan biosynthesis transport protein ExoP
VGLSLRHVLRIVRQWWWLLLLLPALGGATAYRYATDQPDQYAATSTVLVSTVPTSGIDFGTIQGNRELAVTYQQLVTTWPVLEPVITDLGLSLTLESFQDKVSGAVIPNTSLITITVSDEDPEQAAAMCVAVTNRFRDYIVQQAGADNVRIGVAVPARPPTSPYAPKVALYVIFGVAVGALAAVAIVALASYLGASRRSGTSLTSIGGGMILGAIPFDRRLRREQNRLFFLRGISPKADEAIRFIRSRITPFAGPKTALRLAITSPGQGEGKSTLAANLAMAIARTNTPTVLIDANLRAPSQHEMFGLSNETGLTDLLANPATSWISAAQAVCQDLVLITAGPISGDAMELVDARHVRRLLDSIDLPGGIILIDTPAALERGDALEVASGCDGVVIVGPTTSLRRGLLSQAVNLFHDAGVRVFGIVIHAQRSNDIDMTWRQDSGESLRPLALRGPKLVGRTRRRRDSDTAISAFEPSGASFPQ